MGATIRPMSSLNREGVLFLNPSRVAGQNAPLASWISVANWATAAEQLWGEAWVVTPEGRLTPDELYARATDPATRKTPAGPTWKRFVPTVVKTALKDVRKWREARGFREAGLSGPWQNEPVRFVWQRHDLFHDAGVVAARALNRPLVLFVPALIVAEARSWGVSRPGWGSYLERVAEKPQLLAADVVACGSHEIAEQVRLMGVADERVLVTPNGVDPERFSPEIPGDAVRARYGLEDRYVVGWVGSFRSFHGLDNALSAMQRVQKEIPGAALLLVGDGLERSRIGDLTRELGLNDVTMTGTVPFPDVPAHVAAMDTAIITDLGDASFHYSPLKLREYMAAGKAIVAPRVGEMGRWLADGEDALLVPSGDVAALADALITLGRDGDLRQRVGTAAREKVLRDATWASQLLRIDEALTRQGQEATQT